MCPALVISVVCIYTQHMSCMLHMYMSVDHLDCIDSIDATLLMVRVVVWKFHLPGSCAMKVLGMQGFSVTGMSHVLSGESGPDVLTNRMAALKRAGYQDDDFVRCDATKKSTEHDRPQWHVHIRAQSSSVMCCHRAASSQVVHCVLSR